MSQISLEQISEEDRMVADVRADPGRFVRLYDRYLTPVYRYLVSRVGNRQDAEDLTSQVFLTAMERFGQFRGAGGGSFAAWLFAIARNKTIDFFRTRHPELPLESLSWQASEPPRGLHPNNEEAMNVLRSIQTLPPEERELLNLRFAAQLTYGEMARLLGRSEEAVKKQVYRLLKRIEGQLEESHE